MQNLKHVGTPGQIRATEALLKFLRDHQHGPSWIKHLEEVLAALRARDIATIKQKVELFSRAGMGSYYDWFPPALPPYETNEYAETVWWALHEHWRESLKSVVKNENT